MLTTGEIIALTGFTQPMLSDLVRKGIVVPAHRGAKGRGRHTIFTIGQCFGFAMLAALRDEAIADGSWPCSSMASIKRILNANNHLTDEDFLRWLDPPEWRSEHDWEQSARRKGQAIFNPTPEEFKARVAEMASYIREKRRAQGKPDRFSMPARPAPKKVRT
jgi:hypothetical protein